MVLVGQKSGSGCGSDSPRDGREERQRKKEGPVVWRQKRKRVPRRTSGEGLGVLVIEKQRRKRKVEHC